MKLEVKKPQNSTTGPPGLSGIRLSQQQQQQPKKKKKPQNSESKQRRRIKSLKAKIRFDNKAKIMERPTLSHVPFSGRHGSEYIIYQSYGPTTNFNQRYQLMHQKFAKEHSKKKKKKTIHF